jgi:peptidoglycan/LPS O-acetylase OafA/YrhL
MVTTISADGNYKPEVDGLRAVAVLAVILFHAWPNYCQGGFLGVDVFFVISGYLIGGIIWGKLNEKRFSLSEFYARRFRRIVPALTAMLTVTSIIALIFLLPQDLISFGDSLVGAGLGISNITFWRCSEYFKALRRSVWVLSWHSVLHRAGFPAWTPTRSSRSPSA